MAGSEKNSKFIWCNNYKSIANKILDAGDGLLILLEQKLYSLGKTCLTLPIFIICNGHGNFNQKSPFLKLSLTKSVKKKGWKTRRLNQGFTGSKHCIVLNSLSLCFLSLMHKIALKCNYSNAPWLFIFDTI